MSVSSPTTSNTGRAARSALLGLGFAVVLLLAVPRVEASPAQVPTSEPPATATTTQNLLSSSTTTPPTSEGAQATTTEPEASDSSEDGAADDNRRVWYVVAGLVAVAVALTALTIWYWFRTRPTGRGSRGAGSPGRHGRGSAPVDHDERSPIDAAASGNGDRVDGGETQAVPSGPTTPVRGTPTVASAPASMRTAALAGREAPRSERRPLTPEGAPDHEGTDDDWAPRGTGEHDRVVVDRPATGRPPRSARSAALQRAREAE